MSQIVPLKVVSFFSSSFTILDSSRALATVSDLALGFTAAAEVPFDVDRYFHGCSEVYIREHLRALNSAVSTCTGGGETVSVTLINSSVDRMVQYWALCEQAEAAKIILELNTGVGRVGSLDKPVVSVILY